MGDIERAALVAAYWFVVIGVGLMSIPVAIIVAGVLLAVAAIL